MVRDFVREVPLSFLSFDHYCIVQDAPPNGPRRLYPSYFENLEIIASEAKKANLPFWAFALAAPHWSYPAPTLSDLRFYVYSALAYGAQGIQYFNWENVNNTDFPTAPIDHNTGKTTEIYESIKQVNSEIIALTDIFLGATVISVKHTGTTIPEGTTRLSSLPIEIKSFTSSGSGTVVSLLEKGNDTYLLLVNRDVNNISTMKIEPNVPIKQVQKNGLLIDVEAGLQTHSVPPGDVLIFTWKK
jgi:hypothetical protein